MVFGFDNETKAMNLEQIEVKMIKNVSADDIVELYRCAGWWQEGSDDPASIRLIAERSFALCGAFNEAGKLVGMMRALSDGVSDAYMLDLVVHPDYRRHGLGSRVLHTLAEHLHALGIEWIVCIGAPGTEAFYQKSKGEVMHGFVPYRFFAENE